MNPTLLSLLIFFISIVLFAWNPIPMGLTSLLCIVAYVAAGCLDAQIALSGLSDPTAIIYASMFVLAAGFSRTRFMDTLSAKIVQLSGGSMRRAWLGYLLLAALLTSMVSSPISIFVVVAPLCINTCKRFGESPSRYLFALAAVSIGFCCTLPFGSAISQAALCTSFFEAYGLGQYAMEITDPLKGRWPFMIVLMLWAYFCAPKCAPEQPPLFPAANRFVSDGNKPLGRFAEFAGPVIFFLTIAMMVVGPKLSVPAWLSCMTGALLMVLCGVLTEKEACQAIPLSVVFLYAGAVATGNALISTGAGEIVGSFLAAITGHTTSNLLIGSVAYFVTFLLTQVMLNSGVTALIRPILLLMCASLGANPVGPMLLMLSASVSSYLSPMASPVIPACMELGGYNRRSLCRQGWWISLLIAVTQILWIMTVFPAFP